jgi:hypothetical protein
MQLIQLLMFTILSILREEKVRIYTEITYKIREEQYINILLIVYDQNVIEGSEENYSIQFVTYTVLLTCIS